MKKRVTSWYYDLKGGWIFDVKLDVEERWMFDVKVDVEERWMFDV